MKGNWTEQAQGNGLYRTPRTSASLPVLGCVKGKNDEKARRRVGSYPCLLGNGGRRVPLTMRMRPMRTLLLGVFWILCGLMVGCATTSQPVTVSYDTDSGRTVYETTQMQLGDIDVATGLSKEIEFQVQAVGECRGQDCAPSKYELAFAKRGTQPVQLRGRDVSLEIGTETITWDDPQNREVDRGTKIRSGTFARVELTSKQLSTLAGASEVTGTVGGLRFELPYEEREPLRTLLSRIEETGTSKTDSASS